MSLIVPSGAGAIGRTGRLRSLVLAGRLTLKTLEKQLIKANGSPDQHPPLPTAHPGSPQLACASDWEESVTPPLSCGSFLHVAVINRAAPAPLWQSILCSAEMHLPQASLLSSFAKHSMEPVHS